MKRQIFWLIFSCFTATTFLSNSMQEGDADEYKNETETVYLDNENAPKRLYPRLRPAPKRSPRIAAQKTETEAQDETQNEQEEQSIFNYICDKIQIIDEEKLEDFLILQVGHLVKMLGTQKPDWDKFATKALDQFFEIVDKDKTKKLLLQLQADYLPDIINESIEDTRAGIIALMVLEKAVQYAEDVADEVEEDAKTIWNDELTIQLIEWISPHLNGLCHSVMKKYMKEFPELEEEENKKKAVPASAKKRQFQGNDSRLDASILRLNAKIKDLETQLRAKQILIKKLEKQVKRAQNGQPVSDGIMLVNGTIIGWSSYFILNMLSRATCDYIPCVEHFEPDSIGGSLFYAGMGTLITSGCLYYLRDMKTLKSLLANLATQSGTAAIKMWLKLDQLLEHFKSKPVIKAKKTRNAWQIFEDCLSDEQERLVVNDLAAIFEGIFNNDHEQIKEFLKFHKAYEEYLGMKKPRLTQKNKFKSFHKFMNSLEEKQKVLFKNAIKYLKKLIN